MEDCKFCFCPDDPILKGHGEPHSQTDQECPHCGRWFSIDGLSGHRDACLVKKTDLLDYQTVVRESSKCGSCGYWGRVHRLDCDTLDISVPDRLGSATIV